MNKDEANSILNRLMTPAFEKAVLCALIDGIGIYEECLSGHRALGEWYQTNVDSRVLSASVFTGFDEFNWSDLGFEIERYKQTSSHRMRLKNQELEIDLIRDGDRRAKFIKKKIALNRPSFGSLPRYCLINYSINTQCLRLSKVSLVIPKCTRSNLAQRNLEVHIDEG